MMGGIGCFALLLSSIVVTIECNTCMNENSGQVLQNQDSLCFSFSDDAIDLRVVGGRSINASDASWHSIVTRNANGVLDSSTILGGGNLITKNLVLTAAHLFWGNSRSRHVCPKKVRKLKYAETCHQLEDGCPTGCLRVTEASIELYFGVSQLKTDNIQPYKISKIYFHPGYNKESLSNDVALGHDLAILRTINPVTLSPSVQPVCLPIPGLMGIDEEEQDVFTTGFGRDGRTRIPVVDTLQQGCLYIVSTDDCKKAYAPIVKNAPYIFEEGMWTGDQICAAGQGVDSCQGDSGGGLVVNINKVNILIGITSMGSTSCNSKIPGLYTRITSHGDWIESIMNDEAIETPKWNGNELMNIQIEDEKDRQERLVVLGGWVGNVSQSNTVFMETCPIKGSEIPDLPVNISHGVASAIRSDAPSIVYCGGIEANSGPTDNCFEFDLTDRAWDLQGAAFAKSDKWKKIQSLQTKRGNAAMEYLGISNSLWITGGRKSTRQVLDSTEILTKQKNGQWKVESGPTLSRPVAGHCSVQITDTIIDEITIMLIGGADFDKNARKYVMTDKVEGYVFGLNGFIKRKRYPQLETGRSGHACTAYTDKQGKQVIFVAGGQRASKDILDSVESLTVDIFYSHGDGNAWTKHSSLPRALTGAKFINKFGLPVLIGGTGYVTKRRKEWNGLEYVAASAEDLVFSKDILAISDSESNWEKTGEVVETVAYHVTLALWDDICVEFQDELNREQKALQTEGEKWESDNFVDIR